MAMQAIDDAVDLDWDRSAASAAAEADRCAREVEEDRDAHMTGIKSDLTECAELMRRMLECTRCMSEDMRVIRRCVMGDER